MDVLKRSLYPAVNRSLSERQIMKFWSITHEYWELVEGYITRLLNTHDLPTVNVTSRTNIEYIDTKLWEPFCDKHYNHIKNCMREKYPELAIADRKKIIQSLFHSAISIIRRELKKQAKIASKDRVQPPQQQRAQANSRPKEPHFTAPPRPRGHAIGVRARPADSLGWEPTTRAGPSKNKGKEKAMTTREFLDSLYNSDESSDCPDLDTILGKKPNTSITKNAQANGTSTNAGPSGSNTSNTSHLSKTSGATLSVAGPSRTLRMPTSKLKASSTQDKPQSTNESNQRTAGAVQNGDHDDDVIVVDSVPVKANQHTAVATTTNHTSTPSRLNHPSSGKRTLKFIVVRDPFMNIDNPCETTCIPVEDNMTYQNLISKLRSAHTNTAVNQSQGFWWHGFKDGFEIPVRNHENLAFAIKTTLALEEEFLCLSIRKSSMEDIQTTGSSKADNVLQSPQTRKPHFKPWSSKAGNKQTTVPNLQQVKPTSTLPAISNKLTTVNNKPSAIPSATLPSSSASTPEAGFDSTQQQTNEHTPSHGAVQGTKRKFDSQDCIETPVAGSSGTKRNVFGATSPYTGPLEPFPGARPYRSPLARPGLRDPAVFNSVEPVDLFNTGSDGKPASSFWKALAHRTPEPPSKATKPVTPLASSGIDRSQSANPRTDQPFTETTPAEKSLFVSPFTKHNKDASRQLTPSPSPPASTKSSRRKDKRKARRSMSRQTRECSMRTEITPFVHHDTPGRYMSMEL